MRHRTRTAIRLAALLACGTPAHAQWFAEGAGGYEYDSNLSRAQNAPDIRSDSAFTLAGASGRSFDVDSSSRLSLAGQLRSVTQDRYAGLSHLDLGLDAALRHKFGLGPYAPWLRGSVTVTRVVYHDTLRTGWRYDAALAAGLRHSPRWESRLEWRYDRRTADREARVVPFFSGSVFDIEGSTWAAAIRFDPTARLRLSAGYAQRAGTITSTATHTQRIWDASTAWNKDAALGGDGYRIRARTHALSLGASQAIGLDTSLDVGIERWVSRAAGGFDYYNTVLRVGITASFF